MFLLVSCTGGEVQLGQDTCGNLIDPVTLDAIFDRTGVDGSVVPFPPKLDPPRFGCEHGMSDTGGFVVDSRPIDGVPEAAYTVWNRFRAEVESVITNTALGEVGLVSESRASVFLNCASGQFRGRHFVTVFVLNEQTGGEELRRLLADAVVDLANEVRQRMGCGGEPVRVPATLEPVPEPEPLEPESQVCGLLPAAQVPRVSTTEDWQQTVTPEPSPLLSVCTLAGPAGAARFVTYRGVLGEVERMNPSRADGGIYDHTCNGAPVTYVVDGDDEVWNAELLPVLAAAAAEQAGCPLPG